MALATGDETAKVIQSIRFTLLSPTELRKLSAVEVQAADTYDEDGVPIVSGLMDGRLGTLEPRQKCKTCGNTASACPGHFGTLSWQNLLSMSASQNSFIDSSQLPAETVAEYC